MAIDRIRRLPVLLLLTFRPDFRPPWSEQPHVTTLELAPLAARHVAGLVHELSRNTPLPNDIVEEIVGRTDGVPLFVEELTKAVLEVAGEGNRFATALASSVSVGIPATLHGALIARLDRLGPVAREVAQIGAVIGREFTNEVLRRVRTFVI